MFIEIIKSPGVAHLSYIIGDAPRAAVIDPRVDIDVYLEKAREEGARIEVIFETHRNEDVVSGARALAEATGAKVLHGEQLDFDYGTGVSDGHEERLGSLRFQVLHTPGHTLESISIAAFDEEFGEGAVGVFTGDALFVGDVGRTDFYPDRAEEVAGMLWDSIHHKLLPLGDQAIVWPAHGAGSVCGDGMAEREFSTIGHERANNPRLQLEREEFVRVKLREDHVLPPYFREMERVNKQGAPRPAPAPEPRAWSPDEVAEKLAGDMVLVDVRSAQACAASGVPGSLGLPLGLVSGYAGWFLPYDRPLALVAEREADVDEAVHQLLRLGYRRVEGWLAGGMRAWETSGRELRSIPTVSASVLRERMQSGSLGTLLDVRKESEYRDRHVPGAHHRFLGDLPGHDGLGELERPIVTFCGSGQRALVAATLLRNMGIDDVEVCFGSMEAWLSIGGLVEKGA